MGWSHPRFDRPRTTWDETDAEVTCEARNRRVDLLEPARADSWINSGSGNRTLSSHSSYMQTCKSSTSIVVTYGSHSVICRCATPAPALALALECGCELPRIGLGHRCLQVRKCRVFPCVRMISVRTRDQVCALRLRTAQPSSTPTGHPRSSLLLLLLALTLAVDVLDSTGVQVGTTYPFPVLAVRRVSDDLGSPEAPVSLVVAVVEERVVEFSVGLSVCNASVRDERIIEKVELRQVMSSQVRSVFGTRRLSKTGKTGWVVCRGLGKTRRKDLQIGLRST
jgi:hypothetical protein